MKSLFRVGEKYLIRTVTNYVVGKVEEIGDKQLRLSSVSWVAETARFSQAIQGGYLNEVEYTAEDAIVNEDAVIDAYVWRHPLPMTSKPKDDRE